MPQCEGEVQAAGRCGAPVDELSPTSEAAGDCSVTGDVAAISATQTAKSSTLPCRQVAGTAAPLASIGSSR